MSVEYERPADYRVLMWDEAAELPKSQKLELGKIVSTALREHSDTMLPYTAEEISDIIDDRRAVLVVDPTGSELYSFAQLSPWFIDDDEQTIGAIEFRSWLAPQKGLGSVALREGVALSELRFPDVPVYAIVESSNLIAQQSIVRQGGEHVERPAAIKIELKAGEDPASVRAFNLAGITW